MISFIGCELKMVETSKTGLPLSFQWKKEEFRVEKIIRQWQDFDFSPLSPKRDWRTRRHRNYFHVLTNKGIVFEIYCDRGTHLKTPKHWILARKLDV